ncbi:MAG TPA: hypothetical protein VHP58_04140 [Alphaproteobacteria bacterium]|nr:hypothetical protein [Alphaproteobacteria bacterium]
MDNVMKTEFDPSLFNLPRMRAQAEQIARDMGLTKRGEIDAFRHGYVSAKMQEVFGPKIAEKLGQTNEWGREIFGRIKTFGMSGNDKNDWNMDISNNTIGREIENEVSAVGLEGEEKERQLREKVYGAVKGGRLQTDPTKKSYQSPAQSSQVGGSGEVQVSAYDRSTGHVNGYTRSRPRN